MAGIWHQLQTASKAYLWLALATAGWALGSFALLHSRAQLPHSIHLLAELGRGFALMGGVLAVFYVLVGARRPSLILAGAAAAAVNFWYCWDYVRSLVGYFGARVV